MGVRIGTGVGIGIHSHSKGVGGGGGLLWSIKVFCSVVSVVGMYVTRLL